MEGDIADLPSIVKLAKAYEARVMVDDAHGVGVLGEEGGARQNTSVWKMRWTSSWGPTANPWRPLEGLSQVQKKSSILSSMLADP